VIDTATNTVIGSAIPVGRVPYGLAVTPDGSKVYVANALANTVSVIDTATNTVIGSPIPVGIFPHAFGVFIYSRRRGSPEHLGLKTAGAQVFLRWQQSLQASMAATHAQGRTR
jgi:YVTN family beta-propeller protein